MRTTRLLRPLTAAVAALVVGVTALPTAEAAGTTKALRSAPGGAYAQWSNYYSWSPAGVPDGADTAVMDAASPQYAVLTAAASVGALRLERDGGEISGTGHTRLTVAGNVTVKGSTTATVRAPMQVGGDLVTNTFGRLIMGGGLGSDVDKRGTGLLRLEGQISSGKTLTVREGDLDLASTSFGNVAQTAGLTYGNGGAIELRISGGTISPVTATSAPSSLVGAELRLGDNARVQMHLTSGANSKLVATRLARLNSAGRRACRITSTATTCAGPQLVLIGNPGPVGTYKRIVDNQGTGAVLGGFRNLRQGATFSQGGMSFRINYSGGDGNDVVIKRVA